MQFHILLEMQTQTYKKKYNQLYFIHKRQHSYGKCHALQATHKANSTDIHMIEVEYANVKSKSQF